MDTPTYESDEEFIGPLQPTPVENAVYVPVNILTDLSGIPICMLCDRLMEEDQPKCELLCRHTFHTFCIMETIFNDRGPERCITCNETLFRHRHTEYENEAQIALT